MVKKLLILVLLFPMIVNAACNYDKHKQYEDLAPNITYDNNYSKSANKYNIVIYSIFSNLYVTYGGVKYTPDSENKVTISNINPGVDAKISIFANDGCAEIKIIYVSLPYYNQYYGSEACRGYEKIPQCSSQFTSSLITKELLEKAKYNYDNAIPQPEDPEPEVEPGLFDKILDFVKTWGIKILLAVVTIFVTSTLFSIKFRKIKHGI